MTKRRWLQGAGSFLVPFCIMIVIWQSLSIAPFGDHNLLVSDIGTQYLEFMSLFKRFFDEGFSQYSFSNGIGGSIAALSGYYLISPFNLICLFFQDEQLPIALIWIITAKIATMGSTMYLYLSRHYQKRTFASLIFSTSYSLCGFVVAYSLNFMWLDALILLPLVTLGLEKLWRRETGSLYGISLFATIVTNYYLGYMVCLYAVIYSVYLYWLAHPEKGAWKPRVLWQEWRKFIVVSFLAGIATSFVLIPSLLGMLRTAKTNFDPSSFLLYPRFGVSSFGELGIGTYHFDHRLSHLPTIYSGILMVLLFISYFFRKEIPRREKRGSFCLMLALFLSFIVQLINTVWHMFQSPAGFPYRNVFIFSFLLIRFAYEAWLHRKKEEAFLGPIGKSACVFSGLLLVAAIGMSFESELFETNEIVGISPYLGISLGLIWLYAGLLYWSQKKNYRWLMVLTACLTFTELGFNYQQSLKAIPLGSQQKFAQFYQQQNQLISQLNANDTLWRINESTDQKNDGFSIAYNSYNDSFLYHFADIASYTSTLEKDVLDTLVNLGIYSRNVRRFTYVDENPVLNLLLNVKYSIKSTPLENQQSIKKTDHMYVYENQEALGMGLLMEREDLRLRSKKVIQNQEDILQTIKSNPYGYYQKADFLPPAESQSNQLEVETTASGELFMYLPKVYWKNVDQLMVNGKRHSTAVGIQTNQLFNLGKFDSGTKVTIQLKGKRHFNFANAEIATLKEEPLQQLLADEKDLAVNLQGKRDDRLTGTVTTKKDEQSLFLSIPYDEAWHATIDQQEVPTRKVFGSFLAVEIPEKGQHQLKLTYRPAAPLIGQLISAFVFIGVVGYYIIYKPLIKRKKDPDF
ncbi:hypothetical protein NRIC_16520 [Enterococcus florum]|uniref:Copper ABC transporter permease n=1 Tax=Enterococcus florum TaxID=2480627 RepID=A0A4P5PBV3_9ENTE|nr:YfhO family protein [Enterococcus florum]GCF93761.1 hypothetical protein NRIC_16520 [Enterococcus florum]